MSTLHGSNLIAGQESSLGTAKFRSTAPASGDALEPAYAEATPQEIERAVALADSCVEYLATVPAAQIASLLDRIASEIEALGDDLINLATKETGLPVAR